MIRIKKTAGDLLSGDFQDTGFVAFRTPCLAKFIDSTELDRHVASGTNRNILLGDRFAGFFL